MSWQQAQTDLAVDADNRARTAKDDADRAFWTGRAALHRAVRETYDSFEPAKKACLDYSARNSSAKGAVCQCSESRCACRPPAKPTARRDSAEDAALLKQVRRDVAIAIRDARVAAASGVEPTRRVDPTVAARGAASIMQAATGGSDARREMLAERAERWKK